MDFFSEYEGNKIILPGPVHKPCYLINLQNPKKQDAIHIPCSEIILSIY